MSADFSKGVVDIQLVVQDIEQSLNFWRDTLGFSTDEVVTLVPGITQYRLSAGQSLVKLIHREPARAQGMLSETGYRGITVQVNNFDEMVSLLRESGVEFALDVRDSLAHPNTGKRICIITDPEGNHVELESDSERSPV